MAQHLVALLARYVAALASDGVHVVEVDNDVDLGRSSPPTGTFARTFAGSAVSNPDIEVKEKFTYVSVA